MQRGERRQRVSLGQEDGSTRLSGGRLQVTSAEMAGDSPQLIRGLACVRDFSSGEKHLDLRGEQAGTQALLDCLVHGPADRGRRLRDLALRQTQESETGLR